MPENKTTPVEKAAVKYKTGLLVSNSPHLVTKLDTRKTMLYVWQEFCLARSSPSWQSSATTRS